jgi:hypothetical protein
MAILTKGTTFADGDQVTSTKLNNLVDAAVFKTGANEAVDGTTLLVDAGGYLKLGTVQTGNIASGAITTSTLANSSSSTTGVTLPKIQHIANRRVVGNTSGSSASPTEVIVYDEDNMSSNSDTGLATQQSIKAYVDAMRPKYIGLSGGTHSLTLADATANRTFTISQFTGTGLKTDRIINLVVFVYGSSRSNGNYCRLEVSSPDGGTLRLFECNASSTPEDHVSGVQGIYYVPINAGQTTVTFNYTYSSSYGGGYTIVAATQLGD